MLLPAVQTLADSPSALQMAWWVIFDIAAVIGLVVIAAAVILFVLEIPALMRYMHKSSM